MSGPTLGGVDSGCNGGFIQVLVAGLEFGFGSIKRGERDEREGGEREKSERESEKNFYF